MCHGVVEVRGMTFAALLNCTMIHENDHGVMRACLCLTHEDVVEGHHLTSRASLNSAMSRCL
jgi:hypothetical protein